MHPHQEQPKIPEHSRKPRVPLTEEQQALAIKYLPMARNLARPFKEQYPDVWDEFESAACIALVDAARLFEPGRDVKFSTFARRRIWGNLRDVRRERVLRTRTERVSSVDGATSILSLITEVPTEGPPIGAELEAVEAIEEWLRKLPRQHADICRMIYLDEMTRAEIAEVVGFSSSRITYIHLESLAMLGGTWSRGGRPLPPAPRRRGRPRNTSPSVPAA